MSGALQVLLVARRDFLQRGKSKAFLVAMGVILAVILLGGPLVGQWIDSEGEPRRVGAVGIDAEAVGQAVEQTGELLGVPVLVVEQENLSEGEASLLDGRIDALVVTGNPTETVWLGDPDPALAEVLDVSIVGLERASAARDLGLTPEEQQALLDPTPPLSRSLQTAPRGDESDEASQGVAFASMLLLYGSVIVFGQFVMLGVMEEKSSRVVEVLLSRVRPHVLLTGKILGIGALALIQIVLLAASTYAVVTRFLVDDVKISIGAGQFLSLLGWFLVGFAFYASLYAALGSTVTRQEDAQGVGLLPVLLILPAYFIGVVGVESPESLFVRVASVVPPFSPFVMPVRSAATDVPAWELWLSVVLVALATYAMIRLAGRIYEGAILSIGQKVSLRQAWRSSRPQ